MSYDYTNLVNAYMSAKTTAEIQSCFEAIEKEMLKGYKDADKIDVVSGVFQIIRDYGGRGRLDADTFIGE